MARGEASTKVSSQEETATQHSLTTPINDQAAFHQVPLFSVILFTPVLPEAHFSKMSIVCESGHACLRVCVPRSFPAVHPSSLINSSRVPLPAAIN